MKKGLKLFGIVLALVVSFLLLDLVAVILFNTKPLLAKNIPCNLNCKCPYKEYKALFYKVYEYDDDKYITGYHQNVPFTCPIKNDVVKDDFEIIDTVTDNLTPEKFYAANGKSYYFNEHHNIKIRFGDGTEKRLIDALWNHDITIDDLIDKGLKINIKNTPILDIKEEDNQQVTYVLDNLYYYGLTDVTINIEDNTYSLKDAIKNDFINLEYLVSELEYGFKYAEGTYYKYDLGQFYSNFLMSITKCNNGKYYIGNDTSGTIKTSEIEEKINHLCLQ